MLKYFQNVKTVMTQIDWSSNHPRLLLQKYGAVLLLGLIILGITLGFDQVGRWLGDLFRYIW